MQAAFINAIGQPIQVKQTDKPIPKEGECLVRLKAAALNHRDVWIQKGMYAGIQLPCIPGSDGSGIIETVGENSRFKVRDEVIINPNVRWGNQQNFPANDYEILGMPSAGTVAEYISVPENRLHSKPQHMTFEEAAALPLGGLTAYRALVKKANVQHGDNVLVTGIGGGVALWASVFALACGANVYVTSGNDTKIDKSKSLGVKAGVNYKTENWAKDLKKICSGFDVIIDSAGGDGFSQLLALCNPGARISMYGGTAGKINGLSPQMIFWKQISILGTSMGSDADFDEMIKFVNQNRIKLPIEHLFSLAQTNEAFEFMENSNQFGKIVIKI